MGALIGCRGEVSRATSPPQVEALAAVGIGGTIPPGATGLPSFPYDPLPYTLLPLHHPSGNYFRAIDIRNPFWPNKTAHISLKNPDGSLVGVGPLGLSYANAPENRITCVTGTPVDPADMGQCFQPELTTPGTVITFYWTGGLSSRRPASRRTCVVTSGGRVACVSTPGIVPPQVWSKTVAMGVRG